MPVCPCASVPRFCVCCLSVMLTLGRRTSHELHEYYEGGDGTAGATVALSWGMLLAWAMRRGQASLTGYCGDGCVSLSARLRAEEDHEGDA